jgi:hypothetical protein
MAEQVIDGAEMIANANAYPQEKKLPHLGKYVAWSMDCKEILASGWTPEEVYEEMDRLGRDDFITDYFPAGWDAFGDPVVVRPEDRAALTERINKMIASLNGEVKSGS